MGSNVRVAIVLLIHLCQLDLEKLFYIQAKLISNWVQICLFVHVSCNLAQFMILFFGLISCLKSFLLFLDVETSI